MYQVRSEIQQGEKNTLQKFDFVLCDYETEHWYWEFVERIRKLILAGLIGLVGRGTVLPWSFAKCVPAHWRSRSRMAGRTHSILNLRTAAHLCFPSVAALVRR
mgnify:CR=1 FL=1